MDSMPAVALICTANRCRSVMAHAIFVAEAKRRGMAVDIYSAGILDFRDAPPIRDTTLVCQQHDTPAPEKSPTWVRDLPLDSIDRFLVMEQYHADALVNNFNVEPARISLLGEFDPQQRGNQIGDPYSMGSAIYKDSYKLIRDCIVNYLDTTDELID